MFKGFEYKFKGSEHRFKAYEHNFQHGKDTIISNRPHINFPRIFPHPPESSGIREKIGKRYSS